MAKKINRMISINNDYNICSNKKEAVNLAKDIGIDATLPDTSEYEPNRKVTSDYK